MDFLLDPIKGALGGGTMSLWLIAGGFVVLWLATKMVKMAMRVVVLGIGAAMLLSTAPWTSDGIDSLTGDCALAAVQDAMTPVESVVTKRITIDEVSADAACNVEGDGLRAGTARARLRTLYDIPFQEYGVSPAGAVARMNLPDPTRS